VRATALPGGDLGCNGFTDAASGLGTAAPCALQFQSTAGNFTHEYLVTARLDQNFGDSDRLFVHFRTDHGVQATYTDPISPLFNAVSTQPQYEGQLQENHTFGTSLVNQFILSGSWYSAIFSTSNLAASTQLIPFRVGFAGTAFYPLGRDFNIWPQGRNVSQYGAVDDYKQFSKKMVIERILRENCIQGEQLLSFGDGYVEIENTKDVGGLAVAVASDEANNGSGRFDEWKHRRLAGVGADVVIPDFRDAEALLSCLLATS